ncbi:ABC transporter ATP-binding protein [Microbispora sp. NPDC046933]|uniref:ABC transporter ATP-binding protein n=1 Tax=Microbispora sp. NPDC046933 TaxID=3155618 RepID=UPI0033CB1934
MNGVPAQFRHLVTGLRFILRASRRSYSVLLSMSAVAGACAAVVPLATAAVIGTLMTAGSVARVEVASLLFPLASGVLAVGVERVIQVWRSSYLDYLAFDVRLAAERMIVDTTTGVGLEAFDRSDFYDHLDRATRAASLRPTQMAQSLLNTVTALAGGIGTAVAVISLDPLLFGVALISFVPTWWLAQRRGAVRMRFIQEATPTERAAAYLMSVLTDRSSAKEIRTFRVAGFFDGKRLEALSRRRSELVREARELRRVELVALVFSGVAGWAAWAVVLLMALRGIGDIASIIAFVFAFQRLKGFLMSLSWGLAEAAEASTLLNDIHLLRTLARDRYRDASTAEELPELRVVSLTGASYAYPDSDRPALRGVSAHFHRGEFVAIVGENGSGKSTLVKILCGLLPLREGRLRWNEIGVNGGLEGALRRRTGVVFQDSARFALSVRENVTLGREEADARAEDLLARVGMSDAVTALGNGADTMLGRQFDGGTDLSGGQWQRLMIARGLFDSRADLLVLDEASSALDPVAEFELVKSVKELCSDKLVIVVSHRLSSIVEADRVLVIEDGRIVQEGQVKRLLEEEGRFAEMFNVQARALGLAP